MLILISLTASLIAFVAIVLRYAAESRPEMLERRPDRDADRRASRPWRSF